MKCPICNFSDSRVLDSRPIDDGASIKRRRECPSCGKRFTTYEVVDTVPIAVLKRDGRREFFDKHKLALGIERACQKRPVDSRAIAASIEAELQNSIINEISSTDISVPFSISAERSMRREFMYSLTVLSKALLKRS